MKPHPRIRKSVKWGGAVLCVLIAGVWVGSVWWSLIWTGHNGIYFEFINGRVLLGAATEQYLAVTRLKYGFSVYGLAAVGMKPVMALWFSWNETPTSRYCFIPLWFPLVLAAIPTTLAWRLDTLARRRARLGLCPHCQYDRRGIAASAVCPECGKVPPAPI